MAAIDFTTKTVMELRKLAKDYGVKLGAGVNKADIVEKLNAAAAEKEKAEAPKEAARIIGHEEKPQASQEDSGVDEDEEEEEKEETPAARIIGHAGSPAGIRTPKPEAAPGAFHAAWHNPNSQRGTSSRNYSSAMSPAPRKNTTIEDKTRLGGTVATSTNFKPRFGPAAHTVPPAFPPQEDTDEVVRPAYLRQNQEDRPAEEWSRPVASPFAREAAPVREPAPDKEGELPDLLNPAGGTVDVSGVLEICSESSGKVYGWLRADSMHQSSRDVYIDIQQIRRFGLRPGDQITGKAKPEPTKDYPSFLYPETINGVDGEKAGDRPRFEELTAVYPTCHIPMDRTDLMRMADLAAPIGFGSRCMVMVPPTMDKLEIFRDYVEAVKAADPDADVMLLLIDENPEDVTLFRDKVNCPVMAATFDQQPEQQFRLVDLVADRAKRVAEMKRNAVILVDSLTRLSKISNSASAQGGRTATGAANPAGLSKAKRMLGAAHAIREGGSVTVIGVLNSENGNRMDEAITEEYRDTANAELWLDESLARAGIRPAVNLLRSGTRHPEMLLKENRVNALGMLKSWLANGTAANAVNQVRPMFQSTKTNDELLDKLPEWLNLMKDGKVMK